MSSDDRHPAEINPETLLTQCTVRRLRRSGPGGQRRNKVETAVVLVHETTGIEAQASERRSQAENQRVALNRLRMNLALDVRRSVDVQKTPSPLWRSRCRNGRISVNAGHADFPALLAEALDVVFFHQMDVHHASHELVCTGSQLVKLLKLEPRALSMVNRHRAKADLPRLM